MNICESLKFQDYLFYIIAQNDEFVMSNQKSSENIKNIVTLRLYTEKKENFEHLFEIQTPPKDIKLWKVRLNFDLGTLLIGDLLLDLEQEKTLEIHPFPEWVVQLKLDKVKSKPYLVVPNLPKSLVKKFARKTPDEIINLLSQEVPRLGITDLIAVEYEIGINIMVPAFIPHFFISSKINKEEGEIPPYLQVFEPNIELITKNLKIKPTYFFELPFLAKI